MDGKCTLVYISYSHVHYKIRNMFYITLQCDILLVYSGRFDHEVFFHYSLN